MGRSPCCDKIGLKKGPWTPEEDQKLLAYIEQQGHGSWRALPAKAGLQRCGKSCRLRWTNYLRPDIKRGKFSLQEEQTIIQLHALLGNRWSAIATHLPKRTDNEIKNYWNTHLKKRLDKMGIDPVTHKSKNETLLSNDGQSKDAANLSHMAQWESARLEAEARLARQSKLRCASTTTTYIQAQKSEFASTSSSLNKLASSARCIDVLNAWNGDVWGKTASESGGTIVLTSAIGGGLESPTSTISSSAGVGDSEGAKERQFWKQLPEFTPGEMQDTSFPAEWVSEPGEHVPCVNFVEKFTDLLLRTSSGLSLSLSEDGEESDNGRGSGGGGGGGSDYYEDNKNYWNSILNLVDSSPTDSPIF